MNEYRSSVPNPSVANLVYTNTYNPTDIRIYVRSAGKSLRVSITNPRPLE